MPLSISEENYLKAIYKWQSRREGAVTTNQIADELQTKAASVTDMLKKLSDKDLCIYQKYKGANLTDKGFIIASNIVRKHRLWEFFLVEKLQFGWEKVHPIAEQLEHIDSDELVDRLNNFLGSPKWDPHGNPIPDKEGNLPKRQTKRLSICTEGQKCTLLGVKSDTPSLLVYLDKVELGLGTVLNIEEILDFDGSFIISFKSKTLTISKEIANLLIVKKYDENN
ncbi:MAG: metal-dependent transcriptional regulator [Flavobacteriales bacterium]|jgi:DtxR family Mn-dependent transcriptional regulator|nr:metal-dependent transcriptional regulator [Flavobacteriales bacterium]